MDKQVTRLEIKAMTRDEFITFLKERGYQAKIYNRDNGSNGCIIVEAITRKVMTELCANYGSSGSFHDKGSLLGHWGCFSTLNDEAQTDRISIKRINEEISAVYKTKLNTGQKYKDASIEIYEIEEKKFREYLVKYNIQYHRYDYHNHEGCLIFI